METPENATSADNLRRAMIDRSVKGPVLFLFANAALWLLASTILGLLSSVKIYSPDTLNYWFLNYARVQPAHLDALIYGWAMQAGMGVMLWLAARRSRRELRSGRASLVISIIFWNIGITLGVLGLLFGDSTSMQWLEFPNYVWPLLIIPFLVVAYRVVKFFISSDRSGSFLVTTWYIMAAALWFPWVFLTTWFFTHSYAKYGNGAIAAGINAWYVSSVILLFFVPVGLGTCYYFIPKITGQAVKSSQLATLGFWGLAILGGWSGMQKYMGGPLPAWMPAVGGTVMILLLVPAGVVGLNFHVSTEGKRSLIQSSPTLRFVFAGSFAYLITAAVGAIMGTFWTGSSLQFTHAEYGYHLLAIYGFFSMTLFGAIYYIVPRLAGCEWLSSRMIRNHFWFSIYGITSLVVCMLLGGLAQGTSLNDPENWNQPVIGSVINSRGFLIGRTVAWVFILWSNFWFFIHLVFMVLGLGRRSVAPTLLHHEDDHAPSAA